jgi:hypothetical protein
MQNIEMDIQTEVQKIHHQFGVSEKASYEIQKLFDKLILEDRAEQLRLFRDSNNSSDLYVVEVSDEEIKIINQKELEEWYKTAQEFDGFLGFTIKGKLCILSD